MIKFLKYLIYQIELYRPRLWRNSNRRLKDEFDPSLQVDIDAVMHMNEKDKDKYYRNLMLPHLSSYCKDCQRLVLIDSFENYEKDQRCKFGVLPPPIINARKNI